MDFKYNKNKIISLVIIILIIAIYLFSYVPYALADYQKIGINYYENAQFEAAVDALKRDLESQTDPENRLFSLSYLFASFVALQNNRECEECALQIFRIKINYKFNEEIFSPKILNEFQAIKNRTICNPHITSYPSQAFVYIDERLVGTTPLSIDMLPGNYSTVLQLPHYDDYSITLKVVSTNQHPEFDFTLHQSHSFPEGNTKTKLNANATQLEGYHQKGISYTYYFMTPEKNRKTINKIASKWGFNGISAEMEYFRFQVLFTSRSMNWNQNAYLGGNTTMHASDVGYLGIVTELGLPIYITRNFQFFLGAGGQFAKFTLGTKVLTGTSSDKDVSISNNAGVFDGEILLVLAPVSLRASYRRTFLAEKVEWEGYGIGVGYHIK